MPPEYLCGLETCSDGHDIYGLGLVILNLFSIRDLLVHKSSAIASKKATSEISNNSLNQYNFLFSVEVPEGMFIAHYLHADGKFFNQCVLDFIKQLVVENPSLRTNALRTVKFFQLLLNLNNAYQNIASSESDEDRAYCREQALVLFARLFVMSRCLDPQYSEHGVDAFGKQLAILGLVEPDTGHMALRNLQSQLTNPAWALYWVQRLRADDSIGMALLQVDEEHGPEGVVDLDLRGPIVNHWEYRILYKEILYKAYQAYDSDNECGPTGSSVLSQRLSSLCHSFFNASKTDESKQSRAKSGPADDSPTRSQF